MKILRITAQGLPLFKKELDILFYAQQRVDETDRESLYPLFSNIYMNTTQALIGINASGKTSSLKVILLVLNLLNNEPINHIETKDILGDTKEAILNTYFYSDTEHVCRLETRITTEKLKTGECRYKIIGEKLWMKPQNVISARKNLTDFSGYEPITIRSQEEEFLSDDVSIIIAHNKKEQEHTEVVSLLSYTNVNVLPFSDEIPMEVITFLDPTIEKLYFDTVEQKTLIHLKFWGKEEIVLNNPMDLHQYLSSGTIKGIVTFTLAKTVLKFGGYLVVDEIENHFNREIVTTLIRFFREIDLNKKGGTLIFSTHYSELLDEYDRNDSIYIVRKKDGITVENLSGILKRNDIKKSDAYQSGYLEGTTPMYEAYMQLKKKIAEVI